MDLKKELLENHSVALMKRIKNYIGSDQKKFDLLMKISLSDDKILAPRASWAAMHTGEKNEKLLKKWIPKIVQASPKNIHPSVKRNLIRLLQDVTIPESLRSEMFDIGLKILFSSTEPIAVRAFTLTVLTNIVLLHPELKNEMETVIHELMHPQADPAIMARGKKSLKTLSKIKITE